jgi:hypothetical protein
VHTYAGNSQTVDNRRTISGFVGASGGLVVSIIQTTHPEWLGNHPWILPCSLVLFLCALLLWLCQYSWAQKILGIVQPSSQNSIPSAEVTPVAKSTARLKIISAHWGVEGINNPDVTPYLLERLQCDSFAEPITADLFHGFDPLSGNQNKLLTVRYSFDGKEATITRPEYAWLILPEDTWLTDQLSKFKDMRLVESDPKILIKFCDERSFTEKKEDETYFSLENRGGSDALCVCLESLRLADEVVKFTIIGPSLSIAPQRSKNFTWVVTADKGPTIYKTFPKKDIVALLAQNWMALGDATIPELSLSLKATYQDERRNLFETSCELVFDPSAHFKVLRAGQTGSIEVVSTRNPKFRKLAIAVES